MEEIIVNKEAFIRISCFFWIFFIVALSEILSPRRTLTVSKTKRWLTNLGIVVLNTLVMRFTFPILAVGLAITAGEKGWGILNIVAIAYPLKVLLAVVLLDFAIYLQHVMVHAIPLLWRLHRMHHSDVDYDVTTGTRFHPLEIILSMLIKMGVVLMLGPPAIAVIVFELLLNGTAMFNHGNIKLPIGLDRVLRLFIVTPDMHRVHHSVKPEETNSNYGFNLPWWDRIFGTYMDQPSLGHKEMEIGIDKFREPQEISIFRLLTQPFRGEVGKYPINKR